MVKKKRKRTRLPAESDLDKFGMCRIQVIDRKGNPKVKRVAAVDAREIILSESGTLEIDGEVAKKEDAKVVAFQYFEEMGLDELRDLCKENEIAYIGKPPSLLRRVLADAGVQPNDEDED